MLVIGCLNHVCREVQVFLVILRAISRFILRRICRVPVRGLLFDVVRGHFLPVMRMLSALCSLGKFPVADTDTAVAAASAVVPAGDTPVAVPASAAVPAVVHTAGVAVEASVRSVVVP